MRLLPSVALGAILGKELDVKTKALYSLLHEEHDFE